MTEGESSLIDLVSCQQPQAEVVLAGGQDGNSVEAWSSLNVDFIENDEALSLLASLEQYSEHPLGQQSPNSRVPNDVWCTMPHRLRYTKAAVSLQS